MPNESKTIAREGQLQTDAIAEYLNDAEKRPGAISDRVIAAVDDAYAERQHTVTFGTTCTV
jgi:hypothetical protein